MALPHVLQTLLRPIRCSPPHAEGGKIRREITRSPPWHQEQGCVLGRRGKVVGELPIYSGVPLVSRKQNILLKTPFFPTARLCSDAQGTLTGRCVLLPSALGSAAWERVRKELTLKPRY